MDGNKKISDLPMEISTPKLLDEESRQSQKNREKIIKVSLEIEKIFLREDMSMGDVLEVFGLFNNRANRVFEDFKIKKIKENYERCN